jgi:hypothetical protein
MITFEDLGSTVVLIYSPEGLSSVNWVDRKLTEGEVTLSRTFTLQKDDLLNPEAQDDLDLADGDAREFGIGTVENDYRRIRKDVLGLKYDLLIATSVALRRQTFIAEGNISIFRHIDELIDEQIIVGGPHPGAIPEDEFARLLYDFPTSTELRYYAQTRVTRVLREYLQTMSDAERRLVAYMDRRARTGRGTNEEAPSRLPVANELELEKFTYVRDRLTETLRDAEGYSEAHWQAAVADLFLLIFPQYVAVLHNVHVKEQYSNESGSTDRYIDLMLVAANGCADIIEIKKPFEHSLVSKGRYRDNHVPVRELSGSIMQAEKYLFYLSKSGKEGEKDITNKQRATLPAGLEVKIANPKAIILAGRDYNLSPRERFDFEFVRRKYSNVVDVISYDDLVRRLDNIIASLNSRAGASKTVGP